MTKSTGAGRGRPKGARNRRTTIAEQQAAAVAAKIGEILPRAFEGNAHAFLMTVYKDPAQTMETRLAAAKAALPFESPRLDSTPAGQGPSARTRIEYAVDNETLERVSKFILGK